MPTAEEMLSTASVVALGTCLTRVAPDLDFAELRAVPGRLADVPPGFGPIQQLVEAALDDPAFTGWMIWPVTEAVAVRAAGEAATRAIRWAMSALPPVPPEPAPAPEPARRR